jgi:hypothetical protein
MILLDTDVFIDYLRDYEPSVDFFNSNMSKICISEYSIMELYVGCSNKNELKIIDDFSGMFNILTTMPQIVTNAAKILRDHYLKDGIEIIDALIASTAIDNNIPLYSKNIKHFTSVKNLALVEPY